ncbi:unnamed protein product [Moneuplotes crassus]|uniref:Uncharacterized protein n=2 Tax=Euplotes crassus TaxID=5936 RepID=A0AAD1UIK2_EUPCR|nr:unnamed protein product [Moneuplotes crassus]
MHGGMTAALNRHKKGEQNFQPPTKEEEEINAKELQQQELEKEFKSWEDVTKSNAYYAKLKVTEILCCFLTLIHLGNSIVIYELDYKGYDNEANLYISTISIFYLIAMLNVRYYVQFKWMVAKNFINVDEGEWASFWNSNLWKYMIIESIITQIGPQVFLRGYKVNEYNYVYDVTIEYEVNNLLCCFVWIKCYAILRTVLTTNKFTNPRAQRVCALNGCHASLPKL